MMTAVRRGTCFTMRIWSRTAASSVAFYTYSNPEHPKSNPGEQAYTGSPDRVLKLESGLSWPAKQVNLYSYQTRR